VQETVTDPLCLCVTAICPGTPGRVSVEPPNQCGTLAAGPPLHLSKVPTLMFEIVVLAVMVIVLATAPLLEPQPAKMKPPTTRNASARIALTVRSC
jgi:hypothetical protein